MGDRCFMSVTCRRQDTKPFEKLGFIIEEDDGKSPVVRMIDQQANYAHALELPTKIPYTGYNSSGSDYGDGLVVCDGRKMLQATIDGGGNHSVHWDNATDAPTEKSIQFIRDFKKLEAAVKKRFEKLIALDALIRGIRGSTQK